LRSTWVHLAMTQEKHLKLIKNENAVDAEYTPSADRVKTIHAKLSAQELAHLEALADHRKQTISSLVRDLVVAEIKKENEPDKVDPVLAEIVGVRLLLVNLLGPLPPGQEPLTRPRFESIVAEIKKIKRQVALDIQRDLKGEAGK
jgi:hypothetical protein